MSDARVDIVFNGKGLSGAERKTDRLADSVDKVDDKNKKLIKTERKSADAWKRAENKKWLATNKTIKAVKKLDKAQLKANRTQKIQQALGGLGKIGGSFGGVAGAAGEGVGIGGAIGLVGGAAAVAAVGLQALQASAARTAESITAQLSVSDKLTDTLRSMNEANQSRGLAVGASDAATTLKLGGILSPATFKKILTDNQKIGQKGFLQAILQLKESGIQSKGVKLSDIASIMTRGAKLGLSPAEVLANINKLSDKQQRKAVKSGSFEALALGSRSETGVQTREDRLRFNREEAVLDTDLNQLTSSSTFLRNQRDIQAADVANFETGKFAIAQKKELIGIVSVESAARVQVNKELERELELKRRIAESSEAGLTILSRLQEIGSTIGLSESATQEYTRAIKDNMAGLAIQ